MPHLRRLVEALRALLRFIRLGHRGDGEMVARVLDVQPSAEEGELHLDELLDQAQKAAQAATITEVVIAGTAEEEATFRELRGTNSYGDEYRRQEFSFTLDGMPLTRKNLPRLYRCPVCNRILSVRSRRVCNRDGHHLCCVFCSRIEDSGERLCQDHQPLARLRKAAKALLTYEL